MSDRKSNRPAMAVKFSVLCAVLVVAAVAQTAFAVDKPTTAQKTCVTEQCHGEYAKKANVHTPVELGDCKSCHKSVDPALHSFERMRKGKDLCEFCHLDRASKKHVHGPLNTGDCTECHDPHAGESKFLMPVKTVGELCRTCHDEGKSLEFPHGPVGVGQCTMCHEAHSGDNKALLVADAAELCFACHVSTKEELQKYEFIHEPAQNDCIGCHDPHGANNKKMLKADAPDLCYSCHEEIKDLAEKSKYKHSVVTDKGSCTQCHTPHASTIQYGLKAAPGVLCLSCHKDAITKKDGEELPSFAKQIEGKKSLHGPVAQQDCKGCHSTHGSDHFRLLAKAYPSTFYAPFSKEKYDLCFTCHADSLVLAKRTSDLTDFRNGDLNLHFVHVNKERRGRTCRSCHETHASDLPKHIRKTVPYGMWELPIEFKKGKTGGSCSPGCHVPYTYDRDNPVLYKK